jgi:hypothetical protein
MLKNPVNTPTEIRSNFVFRLATMSVGVGAGDCTTDIFAVLS